VTSVVQHAALIALGHNNDQSCDKGYLSAPIGEVRLARNECSEQVDKENKAATLGSPITVQITQPHVAMIRGSTNDISSYLSEDRLLPCIATEV
jgi:hypothetical protein